MIKVINHPFYNEFINACKTSNVSVKLCTPFVKHEIIADIITAKQKNVSLNLITKVDLKNFHNKASDVEALKQTLSANGYIYNCSNLHAKFYIFDDKSCFITSANLTSSGLKKNEEFGIFTDENRLVDEAVFAYSQIQNRDDVGKISIQTLEEITNLLTKIPSISKISYPTLVLPKNGDENLQKITNALQGWKKYVFLALGEYDDVFTTREVDMMAKTLGSFILKIIIGKQKSGKYYNN